MPKAFNETERERLRGKLIDAGKKLMNQRGLKGMSVDEIAQAVGIAKGSFYSFFPSKEEFAMCVLESWEERFRAETFAQAFSGGVGLREGFRRLFQASFAIMEKEPGIASLAATDVAQLEARLPPERIAAHKARDAEFQRRFLEGMTANGELRKIDEATMRGVFMAPFFLALHRDDFGGAEWKAFSEAFAGMASAWLVPGVTEETGEGSI
ncbi:MAG: TetR/AcrR family transcriptional regulator [Treponemataceae bacterium]